MRVDTPRDDYAATVEAVVALVEALEQRAGARASVGVGIPGTISPATGLVKNANSVWLIGKPLQTDLERRARTGGSHRERRELLCGVRGRRRRGRGRRVGLRRHRRHRHRRRYRGRGQVLTGPNGIAGEWGHNPLPWPDDDERPGPACYCGRRGCIETFLSGPGLQADYERHTGRRRAPAAIVAGMRQVAIEAALRCPGRYAGSDGARPRQRHQRARSRRDRARAVGMSNIERCTWRCRALWRPIVFAAATRLVRRDSCARRTAMRAASGAPRGSGRTAIA